MILPQQIDLLISKTVKEIEFPMAPVNDVAALLENFGYEMEDLDENTNGWQIDFWYYFYKEDMPRLCLSGSLFYGKFKLSVV